MWLPAISAVCGRAVAIANGVAGADDPNVWDRLLIASEFGASFGSR